MEHKDNFSFEKRTRALLENSPVCTKIVDLDLNLQFMSRAGIEDLNIDDVSKFYGKPYPFDFYPESFRSLMIYNLEKVKETGKIIRQEGNVIGDDGKELWFHSTLVPIYDEDKKIDYIIISSINTTEQKENQIQLQKSARELIRSNEELEEFAYIASHDLQEPLRVIASYCQLLKEKYYCGLDEEGQKYVNYTISSAIRMKTLIKELLDFSKVGRKDEPFEYVDIKEIIQEVLVDYQMVISESNAKIIIEDELPVLFSIRFRMKQLIANLVSNALKFRSEKCPVINIGCCDEGDFWLFYVRDNGIGIESQYFDRIFGIFKRLYSRDEYPGTGIGLALCRRIVETHGGKIWVDSEKDQGTYMYFTISKHVDHPEVIVLP
jgi:PAS domain S-box-containing protein